MLCNFDDDNYHVWPWSQSWIFMATCKTPFALLEMEPISSWNRPIDFWDVFLARRTILTFIWVSIFISLNYNGQTLRKKMKYIFIFFFLERNFIKPAYKEQGIPKRKQKQHNQLQNVERPTIPMCPLIITKIPSIFIPNMH